MKNNYDFFNLFKNSNLFSVFCDCDDVIDDIKDRENELKLKLLIFVKLSFNDVKFCVSNLLSVNVKKTLK